MESSDSAGRGDHLKKECLLRIERGWVGPSGQVKRFDRPNKRNRVPQSQYSMYASIMSTGTCPPNTKWLLKSLHHELDLLNGIHETIYLTPF